jgi:protoheme IX farnesyltransferase
VILFGIIFIWTPPHFWALALVKNDDYTRAGIPMMPVVAGAQSTINQIVAYSIVLAPFAVLPAVMGMTSIVYGVVASMLGLGFLGYALRLKREPSDANAMALFKYSIVYLFLIFLALGLDAILGGFYG